MRSIAGGGHPGAHRLRQTVLKVVAVGKAI
jgi:hypothetical protein